MFLEYIILVASLVFCVGLVLLAFGRHVLAFIVLGAASLVSLIGFSFFWRNDFGFSAILIVAATVAVASIATLDFLRGKRDFG